MQPNCFYRVFQKKRQNVCLLNISKTYKQIFKPFFTSENWDPYVNFEYKTNFVLFQGTEIFSNLNRVPKYTSTYSHWPEVVLTASDWL